MKNNRIKRTLEDLEAVFQYFIKNDRLRIKLLRTNFKSSISSNKYSNSRFLYFSHIYLSRTGNSEGSIYSLDKKNAIQIIKRMQSNAITKDLDGEYLIYFQ